MRDNSQPKANDYSQSKVAHPKPQKFNVQSMQNAAAKISQMNHAFQKSAPSIQQFLESAPKI